MSKKNEPNQQSALDRQFIFILGAPRSGTTWLHNMVCDHPEVAGIPNSEQTIFGVYLPTMVEEWDLQMKAIKERKANRGLPILWTEEEFHDFILGFLEQVYSRILSHNPDAAFILDKNPRYSLYMSLIHRFIPNARFIHIIRDGRNMAVSSTSVSKRGLFGKPEPYMAAMQWRRMVSAAREYGHQHPDLYHELRYEGLQSDTEHELEKVYDFCGLSNDASLTKTVVAAHDASKGKVSKPNPELLRKKFAGKQPWKTQLSGTQRFQIERVAGQLLFDLGYAERNWWAGNFLDRLVLPIAGRLKMGIKRWNKFLGIRFSPLAPRK